MENYRIDTSKGLEFGLYTLGDHISDPHTGNESQQNSEFMKLLN